MLSWPLRVDKLSWNVLVDKPSHQEKMSFLEGELETFVATDIVPY